MSNAEHYPLCFRVLIAAVQELSLQFLIRLRINTLIHSIKTKLSNRFFVLDRMYAVQGPASHPARESAWYKCSYFMQPEEPVSGARLGIFYK